MLRKLRPRSVYDVFALLALFVAVSTGGAYAANTVFSTDIVDGEVKSVDVGNNEIGSGDVKDNSLNTFDVHSFLGVDVVDNSLTGADVNESTLDLAAEPWHEVGAAGEPAFNSNIACVWSNVDPSANSAAFLRDRSGFVHLKGLVKVTVVDASLCNFTNLPPTREIFTLPVGYRPAKREVQVTVTNSALGLLTVDSPVAVGDPTTVANAQQWVSLDGISFRCAPAGQNGCP